MTQDDWTAEMLKKTVFVVEASHCEQMGFWQEYHRWVRWDQQPMGTALTIGEFGGMPIVASLSWTEIGGKLVMFWEGVSEVFHHGMFKDWLKKNWTGTSTCNADNFHNCLDEIGVLDFLRSNPAWRNHIRRQIA